MKLFVTGMFRSGTTYLARSLNSVPGCAVASDPLLPLFKHFRAAVLEGARPSWLPTDPLPHYYFDPRTSGQYLATTAASLAEWKPRSPDDLWASLKGAAGEFSPRLANRVPWLADATFLEWLEAILLQIGRVYSGGDVVGFKEVWATEFARPVLNGLPDSQVLLVVRDPRGVYASKAYSPSRYPLAFVARHWRKQVAAFLGAQREYGARCHVVRFEDMINHPDVVADNLSATLSLSKADLLTAFANPLDDSGAPWTVNSSHGENLVSRSKVRRDWQDLLSYAEAASLELLCGAEMAYFGYEFTALPTEDARAWESASLLGRHLGAAEEVGEARASVAAWLGPHIGSTQEFVQDESRRYRALREESFDSGAPDWLFLEAEARHILRDAWHKKWMTDP